MRHGFPGGYIPGSALQTEHVRAPEDHSVRIIIADDQKHARSGLRALLCSSLKPCEIWEARTGVEADRLAGEVRPHVILMDVRMPELDGLAATRLIKSRQPEIKIIILSLNACCKADAVSAGADAFLTKGDDPALLLALVKALTEARDS